MIEKHECEDNSNKVVCFECGVKYLSEDQKEDHVATFNKGRCCECGLEKFVTSIRHYNYLTPQIKEQ